MSKQRIQTPNKKRLLAAVQANPGLHISELAKLTGLAIWTVQNILPEFRGQRLVYCRMDNRNNAQTRRWYYISSN